MAEGFLGIANGYEPGLLSRAYQTTHLTERRVMKRALIVCLNSLRTGAKVETKIRGVLLETA